MSRFPQQHSIVTIVKSGTGEVVQYEIDAGPGIARHLNDEAGRTGFLCMRAGNRVVSVPVSAIEMWEIELIRQDGQPVAPRDQKPLEGPEVSS